MSNHIQAFKVDSLFRAGNTLLRITAIKPQHNQIILEGKLGDSHVYPIDDFHNQVARGELIPLFTDSEAVTQVSGRLRTLTRTEKQALDARLPILSEVNQLRAQGVAWGEIEQKVRQTTGRASPSMRTLQRWNKSMQPGPFPELAAPRFSRRGRRSYDLSDQQREVLFEELQRWYLSTDRFSTRRITDAVNTRLREVSEARQLSCRGVSRRTVARLIRKFALADYEQGRLDSRTMRQAMRAAIEYLEVERPYERVELDATPLKVLVVDDKGEPLGSPTLYLMIDCASAAAVGFGLSIQPENQIELLQVLQSAFAPKDQVFMQKYGLERTLPAPSMFCSLVVDNAAAHHADAMMLAARYLGATAEYAQAETPQQKPFVERYFQTLETGLIAMLAGAKVSQEPLEPDPLGRAMREACYTLPELERAIVQWLADVYMDTPNPRLTRRFGEPCSPRRAMQLLCEKYPRIPPPTPEAFEKACMQFQIKRVNLTNQGVHYSTFVFNSPALQELFRALPPHSKVELRSFPLDVSRVYVVDPRDGKSTVLADNKLRGLPPMSFADAKLIRQRFYKSDYDLSAENYMQSYVRIMREVDQKNRSRKVATRRQGARAADKQQRAQQLQRQNAAPLDEPLADVEVTMPVVVQVVTRKKEAQP
ncbi:hypothetical protein [Pseudomonas sp. OTU5201]|uniref:hypothetical protein n=1 Tax=Pseudomonas sp. OTU5201 TaxID=3043850 RepID=UPI00313C7C03